MFISFVKDNKFFCVLWVDMEVFGIEKGEGIVSR